MTQPLAFVSFLGALAIWLQLPMAGAPPPGKPLPAEVLMSQDAGCGGALYVTLRLKSGKELPFIVDTGSPLTLLDKSLEPELGERLGTLRVGRVGQSMRDEGVYAAPRLYLGNTLLVGDSRVATRQINRAMGILGMDYLEHYCIQLDFESRKIRFLDRKQLNVSELGKAFPITLGRAGPKGKSLRPLVDQPPLCGRGTNVIVDTGCVLDGLMAGSGRPPGDPRRTNLVECIWDGQVYTNLTVAAVGQFHVLGLRFLARHLVTLDFPGRMLYLKPQRIGPLAGPEGGVPNPHGGANGEQPFGSETNRTSAAAAPRRSP